MELPERREYQLENDHNGMFKSDKGADKITPRVLRLVKVKNTESELKRVGQFLEKTFLKEEPIIKAAEIKNTEELKKFLLTYIDERKSLIIVNPDNEEIVAAAINSEITTKTGDSMRKYTENMKCNKSKRLINLWADITDAGNLFEKLSVPVIWDISFLATDQKMQRLGISKVLTSQSRELAHVSGYSVVRIDCTSYYSAKLAKALGFAGVLERSLLSFRDPTGRPWIPNVPPPPHGNITVCYDTTFKLFKKNSP